MSHHLQTHHQWLNIALFHLSPGLMTKPSIWSLGFYPDPLIHSILKSAADQVPPLPEIQFVHSTCRRKSKVFSKASKLVRWPPPFSPHRFTFCHSPAPTLYFGIMNCLHEHTRLFSPLTLHLSFPLQRMSLPILACPTVSSKHLKSV